MRGCPCERLGKDLPHGDKNLFVLSNLLLLKSYPTLFLPLLQPSREYRNIFLAHFFPTFKRVPYNTTLGTNCTDFHHFSSCSCFLVVVFPFCLSVLCFPMCFLSAVCVKQGRWKIRTATSNLRYTLGLFKLWRRAQARPWVVPVASTRAGWSSGLALLLPGPQRRNRNNTALAAVVLVSPLFRVPLSATTKPARIYYLAVPDVQVQSWSHRVTASQGWFLLEA